MNHPCVHVRSATIAISLMGVIALAGTAFSQDSLAELSKQLDSDDRKTVYDAHVALNRIFFGQIEPQAEQAKSILDGYKSRCQKFLTRFGNPPELLSNSRISLNTNKKIPMSEMRCVYSVYKLDHLSVSAPQFTDDHFKYFENVPTLDFIELESTKVNGSFLRRLDPRQLKVLRIVESPLDEKYLLERAFPNLLILDVSRTQATNALFEKFDAPELETIHIQRSKIDRAGLTSLKRFEKLVSIRLDLSQVDLKSLRALTEKNVALRQVEFICTEAEIPEIAALMPAMRKNCRLTIRVPGVKVEKHFELIKQFDALTGQKPWTGEEP